MRIGGFKRIHSKLPSLIPSSFSKWPESNVFQDSFCKFICSCIDIDHCHVCFPKEESTIPITPIPHPKSNTVSGLDSYSNTVFNKILVPSSSLSLKNALIRFKFKFLFFYLKRESKRLIFYFLIVYKIVTHRLFLTTFTIDCGSKPYASNNSFGFPLSPKTS